MASNPSSRPCAEGFLDSGTPTGRLTNLRNISAYIAQPRRTGKAGILKGVLLLSDILGHKFLNSQLLADSFADSGYTVVMPDLFHGDPVVLKPPPEFNIASWMTHGTNGSGSHLPERVDPVVRATIDAMRGDLGVADVAAAGYCFGGEYVVRFLREGLIDAGFVAHPSNVEADELGAISRPLSIAAAEKDHIFSTTKRRESEDILEGHGVPYQVSLYSGTTHGFAVRGDTTIEEVAFAKKAAFAQALQWFREHLAPQ